MADAARRGKMALSRGLRCCQRAFAWLPVLIIALVVLWSYYAYVCELCLVTLSNPVEKVAYLTIFHVLFVLFVWAYWKSIFTPPVQPGKEYRMSYADRERFENEERPEVQRQILAEIARKLPVYTRTGSGGVRFCDMCQLIKPDRCHHCSVCAVVPRALVDLEKIITVPSSNTCLTKCQRDSIILNLCHAEIAQELEAFCY